MGRKEKWKGFVSLSPTIQSSLKRLPELLSATDVLLMYLFGSLAENTLGNDVDLAILTKNTPPYSFRDELITFLGTERLDIVDLKRASPAFCFEIIRSGQILYAAVEEVQLQFELGVVRKYHDTAYLRQKQEKGLRRRMATGPSSTAVS
ncbi:MAG: nucleotidyltransferase domain-containing protein [Ardenticatenaceae bacterium]|nr:nucleotidyltransferase domain-containing protein [Ardenticatenaceae bacterium]